MPQHAIVIGAGLAGSSAAERLAARGWTIDLIERAAAPGEGASGNLAGVLRPLPSVDDNRLARLTRAGFVHACAHLQSLTAAGLPLRWGRTGEPGAQNSAGEQAAQPGPPRQSLPQGSRINTV